MDVLKMLAELQAERRTIEEVILAIERLAAESGKRRRGRPPKWLSAATATVAGASPKPAAKRVVSAAARKKMAAAQKKRWAALKAKAGQS